MYHRDPSRKALTLVEIALALGILAIALAGIVSLLGVAADTTRGGDIDTVISSISRTVVSELRAVPFDALWQADPATVANPATSASTAAAPLDSVFYFTGEGLLLRPGKNPAEAAYACTVRKIPDAATGDFGSSRANLLHLQLVVHWPAAARPSGENSKAFRAQIARY